MTIANNEPIKIWTRGTTVCVRLFGQIGDRTERDQILKEELQAATKKAHINLVLDLEHVNMITSFGISILEKYFRQVIREGGTIRMINVAEQTYHSLDIMGLINEATIELSDGTVHKPASTVAGT